MSNPFEAKPGKPQPYKPQEVVTPEDLRREGELWRERHKDAYESKRKETMAERKAGKKSDFDRIFSEIKTDLLDRHAEDMRATYDEGEISDESIAIIEESFNTGFMQIYMEERIKDLFEGLEFKEDQFRKWYSDLVSDYTGSAPTSSNLDDIVEEYVKKGIVARG